MRRFLLPLPILGATALLPACASDGEEETTGGLAYTATDAACTSASPAAGESKTDARARCLTEYASTLLDRTVAKREDPRDRALDAFKGKLRVPSDPGCFTEDIRAGVTGIWRNDIDEERDVGMIAVQLKGAVEFLKHYYRDLDGYPNHLFQSVEVCPSGQVGGDLALTGSRLRVGVRTGFFGRVGVHTGAQLRDKWSAGEHLVGGLEALKGMRWTILDPVGTPRTLVRAALRRIVARLGERLGAMAAKPASALRGELTRLVEEEVSEITTPDRPKSIRERALEQIAAMSAAQLRALVEAWKLEIERPDTLEGSEEGSVSMRDVLQRRDVKVDVSQYGLVNVRNYKQITVDTELFLPRASFARYVEAVEAKTEVTGDQFGLVNVNLNDVVDVKVRVLFGKVAQTGSLDRVLPR